MKAKKISSLEWLVTGKKYRQKVTKDWFDGNYWQQQDLIVGTSHGRSITYFFEHQKKQYVLRHYYRGGLLGKLVEKSYFFNGVKKTRAFEELKTLKKLRKKKLPVPKPVAALITTNQVKYQASIILRLIKDAQDLFQCLQTNKITAQQWQQVGAMIRKFHEVGLYHSDLNIHNIMLDDKGKFWLIDFDKAQWIKPNHPKLQDNLSRLLRSLRKEKNKLPSFYWEESDWAELLMGYAAVSK